MYTFIFVYAYIYIHTHILTFFPDLMGPQSSGLVPRLEATRLQLADLGRILSCGLGNSGLGFGGFGVWGRGFKGVRV